MPDSKNFYVWVLQVIALLGLLALFVWLSLRPKSPVFTVMDISFPNTTRPDNRNLSYALEIENPNHDYNVSYDDILLTFYYGQDELGKSTIKSFEQGKHKSRENTDHVDADNTPAWQAFRKAMLNSTVELNVLLSTTIRYKTLCTKSKHHWIIREGSAMIGSDGKVSGKEKKLKLKHASKIWRSKATGWFH